MSKCLGQGKVPQPSTPLNDDLLYLSCACWIYIYRYIIYIHSLQKARHRRYPKVNESAFGKASRENQQRQSGNISSRHHDQGHFALHAQPYSVFTPRPPSTLQSEPSQVFKHRQVVYGSALWPEHLAFRSVRWNVHNTTCNSLRPWDWCKITLIWSWRK